MNNQCGCERGGDCTKTTMCQLQSAMEDQAEEIARLKAENAKLKTEVRRLRRVLDDINIRAYEFGVRELHDQALAALKDNAEDDTSGLPFGLGPEHFEGRN